MSANPSEIGSLHGLPVRWRAEHLRVPPRGLESAYEASASRLRARQNQFGLVLGLACLVVGLATDHSAGPDLFLRSVALKCLHALVTISAVGMLWRDASALDSELALLAGSISAVAVQVLISASVPGDLAMVYFLMAGFYALCINFVCAFRIGQAVRSGAAVAVVYIGGFCLAADHAARSGSPIFGIVLLFGAGALLTAIVPIQHERYRRKVFLSEARVAEANARLEKLLLTDALTGVANRRAFDEEFQVRVERARASSRSIGLLLVDVDHFKIYNDRLGHQAGDACLQAVAQCLAANVRAGDTVCRYGGEEFVVMLPEGVTAGSAFAADERLRAAVERMALPHPSEADRVVKISVGAVTMPPGHAGAGRNSSALPMPPHMPPSATGETASRWRAAGSAGRTNPGRPPRPPDRRPPRARVAPPLLLTGP